MLIVCCNRPPYYNCATQSSDLGRQWLRYFRKRLHVPASPEVAGLIDVLAELKSRTNSFLAPLGPLELAFLTVPNLPALYLEDLVDAAEHVNIQIVTLPGYIFRPGDQAQWPVSEINTAMAGNGVGLDGVSEEKPWSDNLFSVLYTDQALTAHVGPFWTATHYFSSNGIADFTLGLAQCSVPGQGDPVITSCPTSDPYWNRVRQALRGALDSYLSRGQNLGRVISYGEHAHNAQFDALLREEVLARRSDPSKQVQFLSKAPVYAAARGAAYFLQYCTRLPPYADCFPDLQPKPPGW
ncbi:hypothetical protein CLAIMM_06637 [Cladophialophora immunda]|nr:hypothetical protein CLAIMM_06637 [Cladophialophora immunda]